MREGQQVRDLLRNGLDHIEAPRELPPALLRRARRRRVAITFGTSSLIAIASVGAVYGATALVANQRTDIPPAGTSTRADSLVEQLNEAGVACEPVKDEERVDDVEIPHKEAAACTLSNETLLRVLIVDEGQSTFNEYFSESYGPGYQLYGPDWLMLVPVTAPGGVVETIRSEFNAKG